MPDVTTPPLKARPTTYKGVPMRSRLEAGFAMWLDSMHLEWEYEPQCFADERGQYLPDFRTTFHLLHGGQLLPCTTYVEVKPSAADLNFVCDVLDRMSIIFSSEPAALTAVAAPDRPGQIVMACMRDGKHLGPFPLDLLTAAVTGRRSVVLGQRIHERHHPWDGEWWKGGDA